MEKKKAQGEAWVVVFLEPFVVGGGRSKTSKRSLIGKKNGYGMVGENPEGLVVYKP